MRAIGSPANAFGIDLTIGCLGTLTGLEIAEGWLRSQGGGYAAIVSAERWNYTVNYADPSSQALWSHADGASAAVLGIDVPEFGIATYRGSCFASDPSMNGYIHIKYGGTRFPTPPAEESPFARKLTDKPKRDVFRAYINGYTYAFGALKQRFNVAGDRLVCNQISPKFTTAIGDVAGVAPDKVCITGRQLGHIGSADVLVGVRQLQETGALSGDVLVAASTPYAFGAGLLEA